MSGVAGGVATAFAFAVGVFGSVLSWSARFGAPAYLALVAVQALWFVPVGVVAGGLVTMERPAPPPGRGSSTMVAEGATDGRSRP